MQGLKARRAALARAVRDAAATESAAMSAQRRGFQEALFYLQASGMVGAAMSGWSRIASTISLSPWTVWKIPSGIPASRKSSDKRTGSEGSRSLGFRMKALPTTVAIARSEEHTSELQSLMRISYAV